MAKCKFEHGGYCCNCGAMQYMDKCEKPCDTIEPQTNADRIRAMSDEELADLLDDFGACSRCRRRGNDCFPVPNTLGWLRQPAKDGDNDG